MSSITGLKKADGQRLSLTLAALSGPTTLALNFAARSPSPLIRRVLEATFSLVTSRYRGDARMRELTLDVPGGPAIPARLY